MDDDALLSPGVLGPLLDDGLELPDEGLDEESDEVLGEAVLLEDELLSLGVLLPELMLPLEEGEVVSDDELPVPLAPDAPEELSVELAAGLLLLDAPPAPCAHAVVAKATMAAVTAALMSFRFIFNSSRVGDEVDCVRGGRKNSAFDAALRERSASAFQVF